MAKYHKKIGSDTWHWCRNCNNWPGTGSDTKGQDTRPGSDLCNTCKAKEKDNTCSAS